MSDMEVEKTEIDASKGVEQTKDDSTAVAEIATKDNGDAKEASDFHETKETNGDDAAKTPKTKKSTGRTPKSAKSTPKVEDDSADEYKPGDSVQVKIQGYPWWPAMIVTPEHFPEAALRARPQVKTRKDGTSALTYPVQFLGSPEYYWSRPTDIKRLPLEEVKAFIDSGKKASTKGLKAAYQHAAMEPTLDQLMKAKTELEAQLARADEEDDDEMLVDEADEEAVVDDESDEVELDDEGKPVKKSKSKKKASTKTPSKKTPAKTPTKKRKTEESEGAEPRSTKKSRATPKTKERSAPASPELTPEEARKKAHEQRVSQVMFLRHKLQKCLLGKDEPEAKLLDEIPGYLDKLDKVEANVDLFRETKIGKVLSRINKLEKIPRDEQLGIKTHVSKLLEKWQEVMDLQKKRDDEDSSKPAAATPAAASAAPASDATPVKPSNGHAAPEDSKKEQEPKVSEPAKEPDTVDGKKEEAKTAPSEDAIKA